MSPTNLKARLLKAAKHVAKDNHFSHHVAKAAVERWFAFELAAELDRELEEEGWVALVETGGNKARGLGNFDLLLVPKHATTAMTKRLPTLCVGDWPAEAIAVELKAARLTDGEKGYSTALLEDLTLKPALAIAAERPCAEIIGLQITCDGVWGGKPNKETQDRIDRMEADTLHLDRALHSFGKRRIRCEYEGWASNVWIEVVEAAKQA